MSRKLYVYRNGSLVEVGEPAPTPEQAPFVHGDTLDKPIENLVTGKMYDSVSAYKRSVKALGCEIVGNDRQGKAQCRPKTGLSDAQILDKIEKAESIMSDPAKLRANRNENYARIEAQMASLGRERFERIYNGSR